MPEPKVKHPDTAAATLARWLYSLLLLPLLPLALIWLHWPKQGKPSIGRRWPEHLGWVKPLAQRQLIWVHTVSVGEVIAATPLINRLLEQNPEHQLLVTTTTRTGADRVSAAFGDRVAHRYFPFDLPWMIAGFLSRTQPRICVLMEMELWPNLLAALERRNIPRVLINARMSEKSCRGYQRFHPLVAPAIGRFSALGVQSPDDAERLQRLGASADKVTVTGSLKFDLQLSDALPEQGRKLRQALGRERPIWIAASTHRGEDEQLLQVHQRLLESYPDALLVLVPRHPQRFDEVARLVEKSQLGWARRSLAQPVSADTRIYLGDTMGEMMLLFSAADIAFMGGSLVPVGGHNLLEPAALSKPCLIGPHYFNFNDITRQLEQAGGCRITQDTHALVEALNGWLQDPAARAQAGAAAQSVVARNTGALSRTLELISTQMH